MSLILVDIDHFKAYNDTYGHQVGDDCLRAVARTLADTRLRGIDKVARIGGEEFAIILPETPEEGAMEVANRIRQRVEALATPHASSACAPIVTVSVGVSTVVPDMRLSARELIEVADSAMYDAKDDGRNRCCSRVFESSYAQQA